MRSKFTQNIPSTPKVLVAAPDHLGRKFRALTLLGIAITLAIILFGPLLRSNHFWGG